MKNVIEQMLMKGGGCLNAPNVCFKCCNSIMPHSICRHKSAFTLAEVLITLGIIGVVGALTMPALISGYKKI